MRIRPFEYYAAKNLEDAVRVLDQEGSGARLLAGGTDLVLSMKKKGALPSCIVDINHLRELEFVRRDDDVIRIGALVRHADLARDPLLFETLPALSEAAGLIGSWQIRNVGTLGGNLCNASPAADSAPPLLALDAHLVLSGPAGEREVALSDFFTGPGGTVLGRGEILREIVVRVPEGRSAGCYRKLRRRKAVDVSLAGVAFQAELDRAGRKLERVAVALGGVAPTPIRVPEAEALLAGVQAEEAREALTECVGIAVTAMRPITDVRASAGYRRSIVEAYLQNCVQSVLDALFGTSGARS